MISGIFLFLTLAYSVLITFFVVGIFREKRKNYRRNSWLPQVTVIVPARNEAAVILRCLHSLQKQTYPGEKLQVIIVDDHSTDSTGEVVRNFIQASQAWNFTLISHRQDGITPTYKKAAITRALPRARGEIIFTTDADCVVQPRWVELMVAQYSSQTGMLPGLVTFRREAEKNLFHKLQTLEYAGLVFAGVGAVGNNYPLICNAANLSYRRSAFDAVGGFQGHDHLPSGDDDLLMQNIHRLTPYRIHYSLHPETVTYTNPVHTLTEFYHQRARWASKSLHYPGLVTSLLLFTIYLFYAGLFFATPLAVVGKLPVWLVAAGWAGKLIPEILVILPALKILDRRDLIPYLPIAEVFHVPYIVVAGFAGFFKLFRWKS